MPLYILIPLIIFQCILGTMYMETKHKKGFPRAVSSTFKSMVTLSSAFTALYYAAVTSQTSAWLICWGLFFGAAADYVINYTAPSGLLLFSLGHICYIAALCLIKAPAAVNIITTGILIAVDIAVFLVFSKGGKSPRPARKWGFALLYALILCPLAGMGITQKPILLAAVLCFIISDLMLAVRVIGCIRSKVYGYLCLGTYYAAQLLFALSIIP